MNEQANDVISALKTSIELENKGLVTFLNFAKKSKNIAGKNMFIQLALDEQKHRSILENQLAMHLEGKSHEQIEIPASEIEKILPKLDSRTQKTKGETGTDDVDALNTALDLELKATTYFQKQAELATDPEAQKIFKRLADWENSHYKLIEAELNSIQQTGFWFDTQEFMMDGKV